MTRNVTRIENLIRKLNKADFCKVVNSSIRLRAANEADIGDILSSLRETIAEATISTPEATPEVTMETTPETAPSGDGGPNHGEATGMAGDNSIDPTSSPHRSQSKRKRSERIEPGDCDCGEGRRTRRKHNATCANGNSNNMSKTLMIKPDPQQDLYNFWGLCRSLQNICRDEELVQPHQAWVEQLPKLFDNAEKHIRDDKCKLAQHTLEWRLLAIDVAKVYVEEKQNENERRSTWRAMGYKVHAARDTTLDLLTGRAFGDVVNMYKLSDKDPRRKRVENWLRVGCPLLTFTNHFGFIGLIAPGMRISQNAFKANRVGQMETACVKYLINNFVSSKAKLSSLSNVMENWVKLFLPPYPDLKIQRLSETEVRTQSNLSLEYWGQPVIVSVGGATDGSDCASDPCQQ